MTISIPCYEKTEEDGTKLTGWWLSSGFIWITKEKEANKISVQLTINEAKTILENCGFLSGDGFAKEEADELYQNRKPIPTTEEKREKHLELLRKASERRKQDVFIWESEREQPGFISKMVRTNIKLNGKVLVINEECRFSIGGIRFNSKIEISHNDFNNIYNAVTNLKM